MALSFVNQISYYIIAYINNGQWGYKLGDNSLLQPKLKLINFKIVIDT